MFMPRLERLEDRLLLDGTPFSEPPVLASQNGVLNASLVATAGPVNVDGIQVRNAATWNGLFPGPTLQANLGDTLDIKLENRLTPEVGLAYGPTNLHTHGLHVSPLGNSDNVFLEIEPGEDNPYHIEIPASHPQGLYWYHPHHHEFVSPQIWSGLSGLLVIGRPDGGAPELDGLTQRLLAIKNLETDDAGLIPPQADEDPDSSHFTVNGLINPAMTIAPGETQVWSVANIGNDPFYRVALEGHKLYVVAEDGNPLTQVQEVDSLDLAPGKRYSFLVRIDPSESAGTTIRFANIGFFDGGSEWPVRTLATVTVTGPAVMPRPLPTKLTPPNNYFTDLSNAPLTQRRTLVFGQGPDINNPSFFTINGQLFPNAPLIQPRLDTVEEWELVNVTPCIHVFHIHQNDFQVMSVNGVSIPATGQPTRVGNISFNPENGRYQDEVFIGGTQADIVDIPAMDPNTGQPGRVIIRMTYKDFLGKYVYHCHIVDHEDAGMMGIVNVVPEDPLSAVGAGAGGVPVVNVYSSVSGGLLASFFAFNPFFTGGVNVAVGDINRDGRQEVVVGAGPGATPNVRVVDALTGQQLPGPLGNFMAYDAAFRGGVFVATGDVNSDGYDDVITGPGQGGGPNVRAFSGKDGALLLNFLAYSPLFLGGVRVAAADIVGNGRTQLVTGAGPGGGPHVQVFEGSSPAVLASFMAFAPAFTGGVSVGTGNVKGYGYTDLLVGAGAGGGPQVVVFTNDTLNPPLPPGSGHGSGMSMPTAHQTDSMSDLDLIVFASFYAFDPRFTGGVRVAARYDPDGVGDELLAGAGPGAGPDVRIFKDQTLFPVGSFFPFDPRFRGGVTLGGS